MSAPDLKDYVEVKDRIAAFHKEYPEGSLQSSYEVVRLDTAQGPPHQSQNVTLLIVATAKAYRTPDDPRPGVGTASEPFPGKTPYTRDSELMNAETSAWGRALAALGFEVQRSIASREEVEGARARQGDRPPDRQATGPQKGRITKTLNELVPKDHHVAIKKAYSAGTHAGASALIADLDDDVGKVYSRALIKIPSDLPADTSDFDPEPTQQDLAALEGGTDG